MLDLLIKNGKLMNGAIIDVAIKNGRIIDATSGLDAEADQIIDLKANHYISAGWIDDHVHCYEKMNLYYDYPDEIGIKCGVTSVIDAGTTGAENVPDFYEIAKKSKSNVYALLNISKWGIVEQDELADLSKIQIDLVNQRITEMPDFIVGIKARMSKTVIGDSGITPLQLAKKIQKDNKNIPLMVHIGSAPPELEETLSYLSKGDIVTHCFNGKPNGILNQQTDAIKTFAKKAYEDGIVFDVGHGTASFDFHVADVSLKEGIKATSISTDIYYTNRTEGPVIDLATTMEKMHVVGYTWEEIIERVTSVPAATFNLQSKGKVEKNYDADITVFDIKHQEKELIDSSGNCRQTEETIIPIKTIVGGAVYDIDL